MPVTNTTNEWNYAGNGVTTAFAYTGKILADTDLDVYEVDDPTDIATLKTLTTHYTVSGAGEDAGGTVTMLAAPAAGKTLRIVRDVAFTQTAEFAPRKQLSPDGHTDAFDKAAILAQQVLFKIERSFRVADGDVDKPAAIAAPWSTFASKFVYVNASGQIIPAAGTVSGATVSAVMVPVVEAAALTVGLELLVESVLNARGYVLGHNGAAPAAYLPPWLTENLLINGEFRLFQRTAPGTPTSVADDVYGPDRWYHLNQSNPVNVERISDPFDGARRAVRITQANAAAQRFGLAQIVEGVNSKHLRGQAVTLFGRARCSVSTTLRYAMLQWIGTEDAVVSDCVNDWTSADYTDGAAKFFVDANYTPLANGSIALTANTWADIAALAGTLLSTVNNVVVVFWTDSTQAQNVTLDLANVSLTRGTIAPAVYVPRPYTLELALCQRYYEKSFSPDIAPAQSAGNTNVEFWTATTAGAVAQQAPSVPYKAMKRATPTATAYNPGAANGNVRNITDSADCSALTITVNDRTITFSYTANAGCAVGETMGVHWTADAEL